MSIPLKSKYDFYVIKYPESTSDEKFNVMLEFLNTTYGKRGGWTNSFERRFIVQATSQEIELLQKLPAFALDLEFQRLDVSTENLSEEELVWFSNLQSKRDEIEYRLNNMYRVGQKL